MRPPTLFERPWRLALFLLGALAFRAFFGLCCPPIIVPEDETQIYAIGLKSYTTHTWPFYGPDVVSPDTPFTTQVPGALQGLLVGGPLALAPFPESPFVFLNLLSLLALTYLGWYVCRRLPGLSPEGVLLWLFVAPWTTHYTTQVLNPSYAALGAILFFVGFLETLPAAGPCVLPRPLANASMGFGFFWVFQLHMSWVLLGPFVAYSLWAQGREGVLGRALRDQALGALPMLALVAPTYLRDGFTSGRDVGGFAAWFEPRNVLALPGLVGKFLSFASFEMPRFIGRSTAERTAFLLGHPVLLVPGALLWAAGLFQPLAMLYAAVQQRDRSGDWASIRRVTLSSILLIWVTFWFSVKTVGANSFYIIFPLVFVFSFHCWDRLLTTPKRRVGAAVFLLLAVWFQAAYAYVTYREHGSAYLQTRERMRAAIVSHDYRLLTERRAGARY